MKKIISLLMLLIILISTNGIIIYNHYCSAQKVDTSLYAEIDEADCCGALSTTSSCCNNEFQFFKIAELYNNFHSLKINLPQCQLLNYFAVNSIPTLLLEPILQPDTNLHGALFKPEQKLLAFLSVFRI